MGPQAARPQTGCSSGDRGNDSASVSARQPHLASPTVARGDRRQRPCPAGGSRGYPAGRRGWATRGPACRRQGVPRRVAVRGATQRSLQPDLQRHTRHPRRRHLQGPGPVADGDVLLGPAAVDAAAGQRVGLRPERQHVYRQAQLRAQVERRQSDHLQGRRDHRVGIPPGAQRRLGVHRRRHRCRRADRQFPHEQAGDRRRTLHSAPAQRPVGRALWRLGQKGPGSVQQWQDPGFSRGQAAQY